jgi:hypothetical protein
MRAVEQLSSELLFRIKADLVCEMEAIGNDLNMPASYRAT